MHAFSNSTEDNSMITSNDNADTGNSSPASASTIEGLDNDILLVDQCIGHLDHVLSSLELLALNNPPYGATSGTLTRRNMKRWNDSSSASS